MRTERGKPAHGRITIRAAQEADFVFLTFEDDGGGIDREAVRRALQAARQTGDEGDLGDEALMNVIFEAGFSTRAQSDAMAGRGMGMNIVKRAVARLGGKRRFKIDSSNYPKERT